MMEVQRAIAMRLPDGSHIKIQTYGSEDIDGKREDQTWMNLDISRVHADGKDELLVTVDYDETKGLRTLVFDKTQADPIYIKEDEMKCR